MKWKGREESTNFLDARLAPSSIFITWESESGSSSDSVVLGTDGTFTSKGSGSFSGATQIKIIVADGQYKSTFSTDEDDDPGSSLTTGQKNSLRDAIKNIMRHVDKQNLQINGSQTPDGVNLLGFVQSVLNNN